MKLLLDSHAFLWFVAGDERLSPLARAAIEDSSNDRFLSVASVWEMAIKHSQGRLRLSPGFGEFIAGETRRNSIELAAIELAHALVVAEFPFHHRDPFDRLLAAQCTIERLVLVSGDAVMDSYGIERIW